MNNRCKVNIEVMFASGSYKVFKDVDPGSAQKSDDGKIYMFTYGPGNMRQALISIENVNYFEIVNV